MPLAFSGRKRRVISRLAAVWQRERKSAAHGVALNWAACSFYEHGRRRIGRPVVRRSACGAGNRQGVLAMIEILTTAEMARADQLTIAGGTDGYALMRRAGEAVAEVALEMAEVGPILVVAGRGKICGDDFVAATELARRGRAVSVMLLCSRDSLKGDAARAAADWHGPVLDCDPGRARKACAHYRRAVRRGAGPAGEGRSARDHRGDECERRADPRRRSAERHQRHHRGDHGRRLFAPPKP